MGALGWLSNLDFAGSPFIVYITTAPSVVFLGPSAHAAKASTFGILTWESGASHATGFSVVRALRWAGASNDAAGVTTLDILTWGGLADHAELISEAP